MLCHMSRSRTPTAGWAGTAAAFFTALGADNTREHWAAHRAVYDDLVRPRFTELLAGLRAFTGWRTYRPHNDTRFGGKPPYKTFIGAVSERADGVGAFVQVGPAGLLVGTGIPMPAQDQLPRLRAALADEPAGEGFLAAVAEVRRRGGRVHGGRWPALRRTPPPYPAGHPRAEYLRWKGVEIEHRPGLPAWLDGERAAVEVDRLLGLGEPLHTWLADHVGPSGLTPEERFAGGRRSPR